MILPQKIDIANSTQVMQYGAGAQRKVAGFSEKALENVRTKDLGEVGDMITGVVTELKNFEQEKKRKVSSDFSGKMWIS